MIHKLNNSMIYISVDSKGAELRSICDVHGTEYLWQGEEGWKGQAPILFPIIGTCLDGQYNLYGNTYKMRGHGFALNSTFKVTKKLSDSITFSLKENDETLKQYPFKFNLEVSFELKGASLCQRFKITNNDEKTMPYSIGGHPGFRVPLEEDETFEDYVIKFDMVENCDALCIEKNMTEEPKEYIPVLDNTQYLQLNREKFSRGVLVLEKLKSRGVNLYSTLSGKGVRVEFDSFDILGLWSGNKNAGYLCIEPWSAPGSINHPSGELLKRKGMKTLEPGEAVEYSFKIGII